MLDQYLFIVGWKLHLQSYNIRWEPQLSNWPLLSKWTEGYIRFGGDLSIDDTWKHPLGVYLEKESLYFNITETKWPYQSVGDFLVNVMMNQFNLSNWNDNDESGLYESIDLIKYYYNEMIDRLRHWILEASPHARIQHQVGIIKKVERDHCLSCYRVLFHYQTYLAI